MLLDAVAPLVVAVFALLAAWHVKMAFGSPHGVSNAVPSVHGKPLFVPSRSSTLLVALALCAFALLVAATAGWFATGLSPLLLETACVLLALGLAVRAVGDFRYVGFFKRVRDSGFARMDTRLYSPLCLALAAGVGFVAWRAAQA